MIITRRVLAAITAAVCIPTYPVSSSSTPFTIRFAAPISSKSCIELIDSVDEMVDTRKKLMQRVSSFATITELPPIHLHVTSNGGDLSAGLWTYDMLKEVDNLHTHVDGMVASAGTLLSIAGSHRAMTKHSMMLLHQPSTTIHDDITVGALNDEFVNLNTCLHELIDIYVERTNMNESQVDSILSNEKIFTSQECKRMGIVDEIDP